MLRNHTLTRLAVALGLALLLAPAPVVRSENSRTKGCQTGARLVKMEITDGVHWAEQYIRDGTYKAFHMGKPIKGKWYARNSELCLDDGEGEPDCREVWVSGNKIEFRGTGLEGVLQKQQNRG